MHHRTHHRKHHLASASHAYWSGFVSGLYSHEDRTWAYCLNFSALRRRISAWSRGFRAGQYIRNYHQR